MISTPARPPTAWLSIAGFLVGMAGIAGSITIAFLGMRAVLDVGGQCASGGPYVIATPCPDGTWLLPVAIFAGLAFVFLAVAAGTRLGGIYAVAPGLAWVGLFCSLGFNFLQWGIAPPSDPGVDSPAGPGLIFVLLGLMFEAMGIVPLITTVWGLRSGAPSTGGGLDTAELQRASAGLQAMSMFPSEQAGQAGQSGEPVDMSELLAAVADTVAKARAKGIPVATMNIDARSRPTGSDLVAELERLTTLHEAGNLTDDEFAAAKHNLIEKGG